MAHWADGRLTVWAAVQMVHRHRAVFAGHLGLAEEQVRVIAPADVGGGFGTKGMYYPEYIVVAALAMKLGRPVKWIEDRREHTLVACVEREQIHDLVIAATRDGRCCSPSAIASCTTWGPTPSLASTCPRTR